jgi:hypothetical protein
MIVSTHLSDDDFIALKNIKFAYRLEMQLLDDLYYFFAFSSIWTGIYGYVYKRLIDTYTKRKERD